MFTCSECGYSNSAEERSITTFLEPVVDIEMVSSPEAHTPAVLIFLSKIIFKAMKFPRPVQTLRQDCLRLLTIHIAALIRI